MQIKLQKQVVWNPWHVFTKPGNGVKNDGYDNKDNDYILYVNAILGSEASVYRNGYRILNVLGQGAFGQIVECQKLKTQEVVTVKVVNNQNEYFDWGTNEVAMLQLLSKQIGKSDNNHLLQLKDVFMHRQHLCLVFELLKQLITGLAFLGKAGVIHCDLKPENILLKNLESPVIKIIDFGSAYHERRIVHTYFGSRYYRSLEALLGSYSAAVEMWSLGCVVVELFLGLPLFPGSSEYDQVARITGMLGLPPTWMIEKGKLSKDFFEKIHNEYNERTYKLKSREQYSLEYGTKEQPSKKYFSATTLSDIIWGYPLP